MQNMQSQILKNAREWHFQGYGTFETVERQNKKVRRNSFGGETKYIIRTFLKFGVRRASCIASCIVKIACWSIFKSKRPGKQDENEQNLGKWGTAVEWFFAVPFNIVFININVLRQYCTAKILKDIPQITT